MQMLITIISIMVMLAILLAALNKIYYKPIDRIIEERESKIKNEDSLIESQTNEIGQITSSIEKQLKDNQKYAREIKENLIKQGEAVREEKVTKAREKARVIFEEKMDRFDIEIREAETLLAREIGQFSEKMKEIFI